MTAQTPQFLLTLDFDENALQRVLRAYESKEFSQSSGPLVPLKCKLRDAQGNVCLEFLVDAANVPRSRLPHISDTDCGERTFYYLNGLLNALRRVHLARKRLPVQNLKIKTKSRFLQYNAQQNRVARWKKVGFKKENGEAVHYRELWNDFYAWCTGPLRFAPLVVEK